MMRGIILFLTAVLPACGQLLSFGIKGGGAATGGLDPSAQDVWEGKPYTIGATVEYHLPRRMAVEVDALYQRAGDRSMGCAFTPCSYSQLRAGIFEFPAQLKFRLLRRAPATPFVAGGLAYRRVRTATGTALSWRTGPIVPNEVVDYTVHRSSISNPAENHVGGVAAGGVEFRIGRLRLAPELRYTRWNARYWEFFGSRGFFTGSNLNQVEGLLGVTF